MSPKEIRDTGCKSSLTYSWWLSHSLCEKRVNNEQCKHFMKLLPTFDDFWWKKRSVDTKICKSEGGEGYLPYTADLLSSLFLLSSSLPLLSSCIFMYFPEVSSSWFGDRSNQHHRKNFTNLPKNHIPKSTPLENYVASIPKKTLVGRRCSLWNDPFTGDIRSFLSGGHYIFRKFHQIDSEFRSCSWTPANDVPGHSTKRPGPATSFLARDTVCFLPFDFPYLTIWKSASQKMWQIPQASRIQLHYFCRRWFP